MERRGLKPVAAANAAIYFNEGDRTSLFNRIGRRLEPYGYLVIGAIEFLSGICPQFQSKRHLRPVYNQIDSAALRQPAIMQ